MVMFTLGKMTQRPAQVYLNKLDRRPVTLKTLAHLEHSHLGLPLNCQNYKRRLASFPKVGGAFGSLPVAPGHTRVSDSVLQVERWEA